MATWRSDYQDGKYIHLTSKGTINIDGAQASMTYTPEDYIRLELKGKELIIFKNGAAIHAYDLGSSTSLHGWFALIWFGDTGSNEPGAFVEQVQTGCLPPQDGVGGTCILCPGHASRCVNGSIALECKNDMYLTRTHECSPDCPHGDYPTDGWYGVGGYCTQCHENCNTCVNATTCLECKNQHYLTHDFKCVPECAKGYYEVKSEKWDDGLGGLCKQCHENCSACNSETECTECRLYTYRTDSATCTDTCPDTYYKNGTEMIGGECLPCGENCFECESDVTCKVCNSSYFLARTGECVEHCPDGDYEFGAEELGRQCMKCPDDFNKCITATYASECKNNLWAMQRWATPVRSLVPLISAKRLALAIVPLKKEPGVKKEPAVKKEAGAVIVMADKASRNEKQREYEKNRKNKHHTRVGADKVHEMEAKISKLQPENRELREQNPKCGCGGAITEGSRCGKFPHCKPQ
ncbi:Pcsk5 [Symbiodinium natans]|uniref:Pcsk5 protein n=1 Tax=Symbiodinium natans TaxID=878477 RepID=A0A812QEU8_9DINO|nr:Pcsk5 [Symbiodinium natans]